MASKIYTTAIQIGAALGPDFERAHKAAQSVTSRLGSEITKLNATAARVEGFERLQETARQSETALAAARARVDELGKEMAATAKPTKEMRAALTAATREASRQEKAVDRNKVALDRQRSTLRAAGIDTDRLTAAKVRLQRQLASAQRRMALIAAVTNNRMIPALRNAARTARRFGIGIVAGATGATYALLRVVDATAKLGDSAAKTADRLGMGTAGLQELRYTGERAGMTTEGVDKALERMALAGADAAKGTGPAVRGLADLGISASEFAQRKPEEQIRILADSLRAIPVQADRASAAATIFGRQAGGKMALMLSQGSEGLDAMAERARAVGYVLGDDGTRAAEKHQDAMLDMRSAVRGVSNTIGMTLMPVVTDAARRIADWAATNGDQIRAFAESARRWIEQTAVPAITSLVTQLPDIARRIVDFFSAAANVIGTVVDAVGGARNAFILLIGLKFAPLLASLGSVHPVIIAIGAGIIGWKTAIDNATNALREFQGLREHTQSMAESDAATRGDRYRQARRILVAQGEDVPTWEEFQATPVPASVPRGAPAEGFARRREMRAAEELQQRAAERARGTLAARQRVTDALSIVVDVHPEITINGAAPDAATRDAMDQTVQISARAIERAVREQQRRAYE